MGWFPARDKDNLVPPENLNWPQPPAIRGNVTQALQKAVGKNKNSSPRKRTDAKLLAEQAISFGWMNGKRLIRKVRGANAHPEPRG